MAAPGDAVPMEEPAAAEPPVPRANSLPREPPGLTYTVLRSPLAGTRTGRRSLMRRFCGVAVAFSVLLGMTTSEPPRAVAVVPAQEAAVQTKPGQPPAPGMTLEAADLRDLSGTWSSPTPGEVPEVARPFVEPPSPWGAGHRGVDLATAQGTTISAPAEGTVSFVGTVVDRPVLSVDHGGGFVSSFEPVDSELAAGDTVSTGDELGELIAGGHCAGEGADCVHWGVRLHGEYINPLLLLGDLEPSVLLPVSD